MLSLRAVGDTLAATRHLRVDRRGLMVHGNRPWSNLLSKKDGGREK